MQLSAISRITLAATLLASPLVFAEPALLQP
ncbi:ester cyclase, partial [Pseudomonas chlororaphis]